MKILVTGGAGYIGSVLCRRLLEWAQYSRDELTIGDRNACVTNFFVVEKLTLVDSLEHSCNCFWDVCTDNRFNFIKADILSCPELMSELYHEHDIIFPAAGLVGYPISEFYKHKAWELNTQVIKDMFLQIKNTGKRCVYWNSNSGYGTRPDGGIITEEMPLRPISTYGRSKVETEQVALDQGHVSLRLGTVAGPSPCMRLDLLVNDFVFRALKDNVITIFQGNASRNVVHIDDVCDATIFALQHFEQMKGQAFNVGEINITKLDLAKKISEYTNCHVVEAEFAEDKDKRDYRIGCDKIKELGFGFEWSLDNTIEQLLRFYKTISLSSSNVRFENHDYMSLV